MIYGIYLIHEQHNNQLIVNLLLYTSKSYALIELISWL